jgi:hypothetical protein
MAQDLISTAHPDDRDELVKSAEARGIWRQADKSNAQQFRHEGR